MTVSLEVLWFGSRDPHAFPRITGFCDRHGKARDPKKRDHGYQSVSNSALFDYPRLVIQIEELEA
ncbi:MAG: hypothetical protein LAO21_02385 [Acidobacteriia bacterium]|nr:hypothetical protein [Terriglobia bacterium]